MIQCDPTSPKHRTANATGSANCWAVVCGAVRRHDTLSSSSVCLSVALGKMSFLTDTDIFTYYIVCRWASHSPDRALSCFTWKLHLAPASKLPRLLKHKVLSPQGIVVLVFYSDWFFKRFVYHLFLPRLSNGSDECVSSTNVLKTSIPL